MDTEPETSRAYCHWQDFIQVFPMPTNSRTGNPFFDQEVVSYARDDAAPPAFAVSGAEWVARKSPCIKSKRGVVIYRCKQRIDANHEIAIETNAAGYNGPPWFGARGDDPGVEGLCDGSEACRAACGRRCVHAEQRALWELVDHGIQDVPAHFLRLVHVEIGNDGKVKVGKGPSCVECSKIIADRGIGGIWLYERTAVPDKSAELEGSGVFAVLPRWRYYTSREFHVATERALGLYQVAP